MSRRIAVKKEADLAIDRCFSSPSFISHGLLFGRQLWRYVRGILASKNVRDYRRYSPFRGAVFLWQPANMFSSFCDDGNHATGIIEYRGILNYIQLPKFRMFVQRITAWYLHESVWVLPFSKVFRNERDRVVVF